MKKPWELFLLFLKELANFGSLTQGILHDWNWEVSPSRFYRWVIGVIDICRDVGMPTFNQPSWLAVQNFLTKRATDLEGTGVDAQLSQVMDRWRDFNFLSPQSANPYISNTGPYTRVVSAFDMISPILKAVASKLFSYEANPDVDFAGRTITEFEAADTVWMMVKMMRDNPMFQMQDPRYPRWTMPFPFIDYCEQDLRALRDMLRDDPVPIPKPDPTIPWSMPGV